MVGKTESLTGTEIALAAQLEAIKWQLPSDKPLIRNNVPRRSPGLSPHYGQGGHVEYRHRGGSVILMNVVERIGSTACFPLGSGSQKVEPQKPDQGFHGSTRYVTPRSCSEWADRTSRAPQVNSAWGAPTVNRCGWYDAPEQRRRCGIQAL